MKKTLLKNLNVINPFLDPAFIENGYVAISDETIESVGSSEPSGTFDEVFDLDGKVALPGMINAHHHLAKTVPVLADDVFNGHLCVFEGDVRRA